MHARKRNRRGCVFNALPAGTVGNKVTIMDFEQGLHVLGLYAAKADPKARRNFELAKALLLENLEEEARFLPSPQVKHERARLIHELNMLAENIIGMSFTDLCLGKKPQHTLRQTEQQGAQDRNRTTLPGTLAQVDLAIVTAMREELEPVLNLLGGASAWSTMQIDNFIHYIGRFEVGSSSLSVVACSLWKYGGNPTTAAVLRLKHLAPRLMAMTGICAGWESKDIHFGDVIVAERAFHLGEGKETPSGFQPDPYTYHPPPWLIHWLQDFSHNTDWKKAIRTPRPSSLRYQAAQLLCWIAERPSFPNTPNDWDEIRAAQIDYHRVLGLLHDEQFVTQQGTLTPRAQTLLTELRHRNYGKLAPIPAPDQPQVHYGTFASSDAIIAVANPFLEPSKRLRSVRAIELEVASFFAAAGEIGVPAFAVKGVSDHATPDKDDAFHAYAAEAAARWADAFIRQYAHQLPPR